MIRLIGAVLLVLIIGVAACGDDGDGNGNDASQNGNGEEPTLSASADGPPELSGESRTTDSGLEIIDIFVGSGDTAQPGQRVTVHYTGWLETGEKFDSSVDRGSPATFSLNEVIAGWTEGIPGMSIGGQRRLIIPGDLGYGERGSPPLIPPNAVLIFDVELIAIEE